MPIPAGFTPSADDAQLAARDAAFHGTPDPTTLVSEREIRDALIERHTEATQSKLDNAHVAIAGCGGPWRSRASASAICIWSTSTAWI